MYGDSGTGVGILQIKRITIKYRPLWKLTIGSCKGRCFFDTRLSFSSSLHFLNPPLHTASQYLKMLSTERSSAQSPGMHCRHTFQHGCRVDAAGMGRCGGLPASCRRRRKSFCMGLRRRWRGSRPGRVRAKLSASSRIRKCSLLPGPRSTISSSVPCIMSVTKPLKTPRAQKYSGWVKPMMLVWREPMESPAMARRSLLPPMRNFFSTKGITSLRSCGSNSMKSTMRRPSFVTVCTMPLHMTTANGTAFPSAIRLSRMN